MKKTNFKLFTMFLAGIAFSALTVFAATINVSTNFTSNAVQHLQSLVIKNYSNQSTVILDGNDPFKIKATGDVFINGDVLGNNIQGRTGKFQTYCNHDGTICSDVASMIGGGGSSLWSTGTNGIYYNDDNVGIGTTDTTNYKLSIQGNQGKTKIGNNLELYSTGLPDYGGVPGIPFVSTINSILGTLKLSAGSNLELWAGGSERVTVDSDGDVGIGTNSPEEKLHVDGTGKFENDIIVGDILHFIQGNSTKTPKIYATGQESPGIYDLKLKTTNSKNILLDTKYVGIGTGTPSEKLHVYGATQIGQSLKLFSNTDTNANPTIEALGNAKPIVFMTSGSESMRITAASKVGIGTNNPEAKLQVNGTGKFENDIIVGDILHFIQGNSTKTPKIYATGQESPGIYDLKLKTTNSKNILLDTKYVGIGTNNPGAKLDVDGLIKFKDYGGSTPCTSANDGTMFYSSHDQEFCFCRSNSAYKVAAPTSPCSFLAP